MKMSALPICIFHLNDFFETVNQHVSLKDTSNNELSPLKVSAAQKLISQNIFCFSAVAKTMKN